jgi:hypothetical protein
MRKAILNINIEVSIPENIKAGSKEEQEFLAECELPDNYVSDSVDLVKIIEE